MWWTLAPILTFWTAALLCHGRGWNDPAHLDHPRNTVTVATTVKRMLQIDALHVATTLPMEWGWVLPADQIWGVRWWYLLGGILLMDTLQYFYHRFEHHWPWWYQRFHADHHALRYAWSLGSFYNSLSDVVLVGSLLSVGFLYVFRFTFVEFQIVSCLAVLWTVLDHTSAFDAWWGRSGFHAIHHSVHTNCNFQQPFLTFWDRWLGTDYASVVRRRNMLLGTLTEPRPFFPRAE